MPLSVCMRNSSGASRLSACCRAPPPRACCFGRCSPAAKSAYVASTAGTRSISHLVSKILNSRLELTNIADRRCAVSFSYQLRDATMNEAETRAEHIDPALKAAGWGVVEGSRIRREYPIAPGRIEGHGRRGKAITADYVLEYRNTKLAVVEAKALDEDLTEGVGQAKNYA